MLKVLLINSSDQIKSTGADPEGSVFKKYLEEGYRPIGTCTGWNFTVKDLDASDFDQSYLKAYKKNIHQ